MPEGTWEMTYEHRPRPLRELGRHLFHVVEVSVEADVLGIFPGAARGAPTSTRTRSPASAVLRRLEHRYVAQGCKRRLALNKPRDYLCRSRATGKTDEIVFTFAALDPSPGHPARSQSNAYYFDG